MVGSRFTHSAECRYTPIEGEALALALAVVDAEGQTLRLGMLQPHSCGGPQATTEDIRRQTPGGHPQRLPQEPKGEDSKIPLLYGPHPRDPQQRIRRTLPSPLRGPKPAHDAFGRLGDDLKL